MQFFYHNLLICSYSCGMYLLLMPYVFTRVVAFHLCEIEIVLLSLAVNVRDMNICGGMLIKYKIPYHIMHTVDIIEILKNIHFCRAFLKCIPSVHNCAVLFITSNDLLYYMQPMCNNLKTNTKNGSLLLSFPLNST